MERPAHLFRPNIKAGRGRSAMPNKDKKCLVEGCSNLVGPHGAKGMCQIYYSRWRNHGDPNAVVRSSEGLTKDNPVEFKTWCSMINRCKNKNDKRYKDWGGRGIRVCDRWIKKPDGFRNFLEDMGKRPGKDYSIDRIDNDGNYCPENCKWSTRSEQVRNRRERKNYKRKDNINVTWHGETHHLGEWAKILDIKYNTLYMRYKRYGIDQEKLFIRFW